MGQITDFGNVVFMHEKTNQETIFSWSVNPLSGAMMYWFSNDVSMYVGTKKTR